MHGRGFNFFAFRVSQNCTIVVVIVVIVMVVHVVQVVVRGRIIMSIAVMVIVVIHLIGVAVSDIALWLVLVGSPIDTNKSNSVGKYGIKTKTIKMTRINNNNNYRMGRPHKSCPFSLDRASAAASTVTKVMKPYNKFRLVSSLLIILTSDISPNGENMRRISSSVQKIAKSPMKREDLLW